MEAMRTLRAADGAQIAYCASAPAAQCGALVLLHGVASNHTRWTEFARETALRDRWALLRPDLRGQGASTFRGRIGLAELCTDLAGLLDAEQCSRAVIAGHCLGANLALAFAASHPGRTAGLVLIEPMPTEALAGAMRRLRRLRILLRLSALLVRAFNALGVHRRKLAPLDLEALDRETRAALARGPEGEAQLARYASPLADLRSTATGAYLQALMAVTEPLPHPERIESPVLALISGHRGFTEPQRTRGFLSKIPDCEIAEIRSRHWIPTEQPRAMRSAIETWVRARFERIAPAP
jgi:pimeloyl-ACP methyl ester carboxylesterase